MPRYFANCSYDGSAYHGWQVQQNANSVQAVINKALSTYLKSEIFITGAGRTDTGVHAEQMTFHFDSGESIDDLNELCYRLNSMTPKDVAVQSIWMVDDEAHSRFDAISRSYKYILTKVKDPFKVNRAYYFPHSLDVDKMNRAGEIIMKHKHFSCFAKSGGQQKTDICKVSRAEWTEDERSLIFHITADRFLRNMVRAIVGTMLEIGQGKLSVDELEKVIASEKREEAGFSVPAEGLYLTDIVYPENLSQDV